jgi:ketosteroid isomerase-like protein
MIPIWRDDAIAAAVRQATADLLTQDFECVFVREDLGRSTYHGVDGLRAAMLDWLEPWDSYQAGVEGVIDAGQGRVVVLTRDHARPKGSSAEVDFLGAPVWSVRDGLATGRRARSLHQARRSESMATPFRTTGRSRVEATVRGSTGRATRPRPLTLPLPSDR